MATHGSTQIHPFTPAFSGGFDGRKPWIVPGLKTWEKENCTQSSGIQCSLIRATWGTHGCVPSARRTETRSSSGGGSAPRESGMSEVAATLFPAVWRRLARGYTLSCLFTLLKQPRSHTYSSTARATYSSLFVYLFIYFYPFVYVTAGENLVSEEESCQPRLEAEGSLGLTQQLARVSHHPV